eukprot:GHVT01094018.1.p1 GENE.GHVT01094018.1~~GHVT01094018.1.p1  ORF type:complete len:253 (+),score=36.49 GHVT01094018.1:1159-1917(+)
MADELRLAGMPSTDRVKIGRTAAEESADGGAKKEGVMLEKVDNVWGSSAGAGSDFFDIYRKHRYREMDRLKTMDEDWKVRMEHEEHQLRREQRMSKAEEDTRKRAEKRKRRKHRREDAKREAKSVNKRSRTTAGEGGAQQDGFTQSPEAAESVDDGHGSRATPASTTTSRQSSATKQPGSTGSPTTAVAAHSSPMGAFGEGGTSTDTKTRCLARAASSGKDTTAIEPLSPIPIPTAAQMSDPKNIIFRDEED